MNPFAALGLDARPGLSDAQVRDAWRAIAAATHPDRADGGNPDAYAAASAAYAALRTPWARSEAYADLLARAVPAAPPPGRAVPQPAGRAVRWLALGPARIRHGRPRILGLRVLVEALLAVITLHSGAGPAPIAGTLTGTAIWLALTARGDLTPPPGR